MNIKEFIKELLITNQGIIIPGLGGFVSEYEPACFDVKANKFLPPSKKIYFKPEYTYHDNILIDYISKKENIDKEKAESVLKDFVKDTKFKLEKGEQIIFPGLGALTQESKNKFSFVQDPETNLLTSSFGLKSIQPKTATVKNGQVIKSAYTEKVKKSYNKFYIFGSIAIIIIGMVITGWYLSKGFSDFSFLALSNKNNIEVKNIDNELVIQETEKNLDSIAKADSIKALINKSIDENTEKKEALFYTDTEEGQSNLQGNESEPAYTEYHIIAGSFKKMENAQRFSSELKNKGYDPKIIQSGENLYRISIYTYTDETSALKELYKLRQTSHIKSVWILKSI